MNRSDAIHITPNGNPLQNRIYIDCETISVHRGRLPWDVGVVQHSSTGGRQEHSWIIKDVDLTDADRNALNAGHFQDRHPLAGARLPHGAEYATEREVAHAVFKLAFNATIAGIVVDFDTRALDNMFQRHNLFWPAYHHLVCVENRALGVLQGHAMYLPEVAEGHAELLARAEEIPGRWITDEIAAAFGVPPLPEHERHTAIGDARLAERIFHAALVDKVVPKPGVRWAMPLHMVSAAA
jgi:hypothetical protein